MKPFKYPGGKTQLLTELKEIITPELLELRNSGSFGSQKY